MKTKLHNTKITQNKRRSLRQQDVACEKILWHKLRNRAFMGLKFRRQFGIGMFIVDFYCPEIKLVIEVDGATHSLPDEVVYDQRRQNYLESLGVHVKRYTNTDVKENLGELMYNLSEFCSALLARPTSP